MDEQLYFHHYERFHAEHRIDASVKAKEAKLVEEIVEYLDNPSDEEALDILNVAMSLCRARGVHNVLHAGYMKLQANSERYRREASCQK
jgi:predicted house-cleaning noncanonical NTP pyrophosphatase (MazG superfamily)